MSCSVTVTSNSAAFCPLMVITKCGRMCPSSKMTLCSAGTSFSNSFRTSLKLVPRKAERSISEGGTIESSFAPAIFRKLAKSLIVGIYIVSLRASDFQWATLGTPARAGEQSHEDGRLLRRENHPPRNDNSFCSYSLIASINAKPTGTPFCIQ